MTNPTNKRQVLRVEIDTEENMSPELLQKLINRFLKGSMDKGSMDDATSCSVYTEGNEDVANSSLCSSPVEGVELGQKEEQKFTKLIHIKVEEEVDAQTLEDIKKDFIKQISEGNVYISRSNVYLEEYWMPELKLTNSYKNDKDFLESNAYSYACRELALIGMEEDTADEMNKAMRDHLMEMLRVFHKEGHSGFSANYASNMFNKLSRFEVLSPLTGEDDEWTQIETNTWQNKRAFNVFKGADQVPYQMDYYIFRDEDGGCCTNSDSRKTIESFPYTPSHEYIDRIGGEIQDERFKKTKKKEVVEVKKTKTRVARTKK